MMSRLRDDQVAARYSSLEQFLSKLQALLGLIHVHALCSDCEFQFLYGAEEEAPVRLRAASAAICEGWFAALSSTQVWFAAHSPAYVISLWPLRHLCYNGADAAMSRVVRVRPCCSPRARWSTALILENCACCRVPGRVQHTMEGRTTTTHSRKKSRGIFRRLQ